MSDIYGYTANEWKGTYVNIAAKIPKVGQIIYCSDQDWFVIGDNVNTVSILKKYRVPDSDSISANKTYTSADNYQYIFVTAGSGSPLSVVLPSAVLVKGREYTIKKIDTGTANINITAGVSQIEGQSSYQLSDQFDSLTVASDGSAYFIKTAPGGAGGAIIEVTLAETVTALKAIAYDSSGEGILADITDTDKLLVAGISLTGGSSPAIIECQKIGELASTAHGFTIGRQYYLGASGLPVLKESVPGNVPTIPLFIPRDANTLDVSIGQLEIESNDYNQLVIGDMLNSYNSAPRASFLIAEFDNAVLQSAYPDLYAVVGDNFEAEHVAAGDTASGVGNFFPTPVPGSYSRAAVSLDIVVTSVDSGTERMTIPTADYNRLNSLRGSGLPIKLTVVSGTLTGGLIAETEYFIGFISAGVISFYTTEDNAVTDTSPVNLTDTNVGTFTFHQTGIYFDDAFQGHYHEGNRGTIDGNYGKVDSSSGGTVFDIALDIVTDGVNGTPRTTNETRPKTAMQYAFIKAVDIDLTSGQSVTAIKFDSGWIANSDWTSLDETITHGLNEDFSKLIFKCFISTDGTESNVIDTVSVSLDGVSSGSDGLQFFSVDSNNVRIMTAVSGMLVVNQASKAIQRLDTESYYYKIVCYNPQFTTKVYEKKTFTYDQTSSSHTHNLPDATTYIGDITIKGSNGTVSGFNLLFNTVGSQTIDGDADTIWKIEGNGIITLSSDGANWIVDSYTDSGSNANGEWEKYINGKAKGFDFDIAVSGNPVTITIPYTFQNTNYVVKDSWINNAADSGSRLTTGKTTSSFDVRQASTTSTYDYEAYGDWK